MDPKDKPEDNQSSQKEKTLPTYVFGEDYKQTINLANKDQAQSEPEITPEEEKSAEQSKIVKEEKDKILSEAVSAELEKMNLEKIKPISMIVNKKKFRIRFLVLVLILLGISFGSLYGVSYVLEQGIIGTRRHSASGISMEELICEMTGSNSDLLGMGNALDTKSTIKASYANGEFSSITQTFEARFENSSTAKIALGKARSEYVKRFKGAGIATEPFSSEYNQDGESITVIHQADKSDINKNNATVMHIDVNKNGVVVYDIDSIKKNYESLGYACSIQ